MPGKGLETFKIKFTTNNNKEEGFEIKYFLWLNKGYHIDRWLPMFILHGTVSGKT